VASNTIPLGSTIEFVHPRRVFGRRYFKVLDTGGPGFLTDIWVPSCSQAIQFGRRQVVVRTVRLSTRARITHERVKASADWRRIRAGKEQS
jgi:hypothetical protein